MCVWGSIHGSEQPLCWVCLACLLQSTGWLVGWCTRRRQKANSPSLSPNRWLDSPVTAPIFQPNPSSPSHPSHSLSHQQTLLSSGNPWGCGTYWCNEISAVLNAWCEILRRSVDLCGGIGTSCGNTLEVLHGYLVWYYLRTSKLEVLHGYLVWGFLGWCGKLYM